jgi:hypothetical protein
LIFGWGGNEQVRRVGEGLILKIEGIWSLGWLKGVRDLRVV